MAAELGNAQQKLQQVQMLPVFIGIGLGVLLGSIPLFIPGFPAALKLGLAGGPLIMALILGRIGSIGKLYWFMPPSANLALRELGIVLFLAVVGLKSGGDFVATLTQGDGLSWIAYGIFITAIPLLTLPQFIMLQYVNGKAENWHTLSGYDKFNTLAWELISHLWFLLVLVVLTSLGVVLFKWLTRRPAGGVSAFSDTVTMGQLTMIFLALGVLYALIRRSLFVIYPPLLSNGLFNFVVMQTLFYLPFFVLGAQTFINPRLKAMFTTPSPWCCAAALLGFIAYRLNQQYGSGDGWMYETESVITMVLGLWMVNVVFSLGHRLLNFQSARVTYFVNASLFIYLVHHPLTLLYGAWITPVIKSNTLGFIGGLVFVVGIALILYEIHLRIPLLRFLFSGKPMNKPAKTPASAS